MELTDTLAVLHGIGETRRRAFKKLGIETLGDLISFFPRAYDDRTAFLAIADTVPGESACIRAVVADEPRLSRIRRGLELVRFRAYDESGSVTVTYFNQSYLKNTFHRGEEYVFYGKLGGNLLKRELTNPVFERVGAKNGVTGRIVPIYRMTAGISQKLVSGCVAEALDGCLDYLPDVLPESVRREYSLAHAHFAYKQIHFPEDANSLALARKRLIFEELFVLSCALGSIRGERVKSGGVVPEAQNVDEFYASLPFTPTNAQKKCVAEAVADMRSGGAMNRLLQGDVGSGKTLVAAACVWYMCRSGYQCAFMAPTELLAEQHLKTLSDFLSPLGVSVGLLTGHMTAKQKREALQRLESGETQLVIGTHALISENVKFKNLALVVTDEQHRFGVAQRAALLQKGSRAHVLVMSATPIPRTLALIIYGDLDVSVIDELPPGRLPVDTFAVDESKRVRLNGFIRKQVEEGRQVFIVCPLIEEGETTPEGLKSAQTYAEELQNEVFPDLRVSLIHGKMKPAEKEAQMAAFAEGCADILVATTIIEVGIDVPNASLMVIENAERFGLSQLHQLRGRVGRGGHKSYCVLVSDSSSETSRERLGAMCKTQSGFKIAEEDLRLRGPGDFFGERQHGLPEMHIADLSYDMDLLQSAQRAAEETLRLDLELEREENLDLRRRINELFERNYDSFN